MTTSDARKRLQELLDAASPNARKPSSADPDEPLAKVLYESEMGKWTRADSLDRAAYLTLARVAREHIAAKPHKCALALYAHERAEAAERRVEELSEQLHSAEAQLRRTRLEREFSSPETATLVHDLLWRRRDSATDTVCIAATNVARELSIGRQTAYRALQRLLHENRLTVTRMGTGKDYPSTYLVDKPRDHATA